VWSFPIIIILYSNCIPSKSLGVVTTSSSHCQSVKNGDVVVSCWFFLPCGSPILWRLRMAILLLCKWKLMNVKKIFLKNFWLLHSSLSPYLPHFHYCTSRVLNVLCILHFAHYAPSWICVLSFAPSSICIPSSMRSKVSKFALVNLVHQSSIFIFHTKKGVSHLHQERLLVDSSFFSPTSHSS